MVQHLHFVLKFPLKIGCGTNFQTDNPYEYFAYQPQCSLVIKPAKKITFCLYETSILLQTHFLEICCFITENHEKEANPYYIYIVYAIVSHGCVSKCTTQKSDRTKLMIYIDIHILWYVPLIFIYYGIPYMLQITVNLPNRSTVLPRGEKPVPAVSKG